MNFKLAFQLSLLGLAMAFATISLIPEQFEFIFWIILFLLIAYVVARKCSGHYFWNGFLVSIFNCFWITLVHTIYYRTYNLNHPDMAAMGNTGYFKHHARHFILVTGPLFGIVFALIQGLFALGASYVIKRR